MKKIQIKDGNVIIDTIELKKNMNLRQVAEAIVWYGEENDWFEKEEVDFYCRKCGKILNPDEYHEDICYSCGKERGIYR